MKSRPAWLLVSCLLCCPKAPSQTLVYTLSYVETRASFQARFANVSLFPGQRTEQENVAMLRNTRKTEIYSVSVTEGRRALLFSDEGGNLEIRASGAVYGNKAYMGGVWRERRTVPNPGMYSEDSVYEISLDGSKQFRRVLNPPPGRVPALLNPQGSRAAFETSENGNFAVSIYAVPEWKLLQSWDLTKLIQEHCPLCTPASSDWLADGGRLYFEMVIAGDYDEEESKSSVPGTYLVSEEGKDLGKISPDIGALHLDGFSHPNSIDRHFLGQRPDGDYIFQDYLVRKGKSPSELEPFLVIASPDSKSQKVFSLKFTVGRGSLSPSGNYLAYIEDRRTPNYRTEQHLWIKDLRSGEEKELFAAPAAGAATSPEPNVYLSVLGWMN